MSSSVQPRVEFIAAMQKAPNPGLLRKAAQTELMIFRLIQERPSVSRVELARNARLSSAAITSVVASLSGRGLLIEGEGVSTGVGRKRVGLRLRQELGYVVGVDFGTFNLRIAVTDLNGTALASVTAPTQMFLSRSEVLERCFRLIREVVAKAGLPMAAIRGIGVALSGVIDVARGVMLSYPRPKLAETWRNVPIKQLFEDEFGIPCVLEYSVRAAARTERAEGAGAAFSDFIYVDVGMGVGASIFMGGQIYRGSNGSAGEFGHVTIDENGPLCCCGSHGCLEVLGSGARLIEIVTNAVEKGVSSRVIELADLDPDKITIELIAQAAREGDSLAYRALAEVATHIGAASADLVNLLNPEAIIYGGALFRSAKDTLLEHLQRIIRHRAMEKPANEVKLLIAQSGIDAGSLGMARITAARVLDAVYHESVFASA